MLAACAGRAVRTPPAEAAAPLNNDRDHALGWLRPADGLYGWNWSSGVVKPAASCGAGAFTLAFNQGNTPPPAALSHGGVGTAGSALCRRGPPAACPRGRGSATCLRPARNHDQQGGHYSASTEHRQRPWLDRPDLLEWRDRAGASGWDRGRRGCHWSAGHRLLGDRAALCRVGVQLAGKDPAQQSHRVRDRGAGPEHHAVADPASLWNQAGEAVGLERAG